METNNNDSIFLWSYCADDPFWDWRLSWRTPDPAFTFCFLDTVSQVFPSLFLFLAIIFCPYIVVLPEIIQDPKSQREEDDDFEYKDEKDDDKDDDEDKDNSQSRAHAVISLAKFSLSLAVYAASVFRLFFFASSDVVAVDSLQAAFFESPAPFVNAGALMISSALAARVAFVEYRSKTFQTSSVSFIYWTLVFGLHLLPVRSFVKFGQASTASKLFPITAADQAATQTSLTISLYMIVACSFLLSMLHAIRSLGLPGTPFDRAGALSRWTYCWVIPTMIKGFRNTLNIKDVDALPEELLTETLLKKVEEKMAANTIKAKEMKKKGIKDYERLQDLQETADGKPIYRFSVLFTTLSCYKMDLVLNIVLRLLYILIDTSKAVILGWLLNHVSHRADFGRLPDFDSREWLWKGLFFALLLFMASIVSNCLQYITQWRMTLLGLMVRNTAMMLIFDKMLSISLATRQSSTAGKILNLMSSDAKRLYMGLEVLFIGLMTPLQLVVIVWLLYKEIGPASMASVACLMSLLPVTIFAGNQIMKLQAKTMIFKDTRVKLMNEILNGIKVVKFYAWEKSFIEKVVSIRNQELGVLRTQLYWRALMRFIYSTEHIIVSIVTFTTFMFVHYSNVLTAEKAFVSLTLFNSIRVPLWALPEAIFSNIQMFVSSQRINHFLNNPDIHKDEVNYALKSDEALYLNNATYAWDPNSEPFLKSLNFSVKTGEMIAVVGTVGSGKSTLLNALMGEMSQIRGARSIVDKIAYVSQQPWIQNGTIRENILFGKKMNEKRYNRVVEACALLPDLAILPSGDQTEIGGKGVNLSGGQKVRVSLARAVYDDADLYFLDDPFSAVDSHVRKYLYENVLSSKGMLGKKTRVFVTNDLSYLPMMDSVICIDNGRVEKGTFSQLLEKNPSFSKFVKRSGEEEEEEETEKEDKTEKPKKKETTDGKLTVMEESTQDSVKMRVYFLYLKSFGKVLSSLFLASMVGMQCFEIWATVKLSSWSDSATSSSRSASKKNFIDGNFKQLVMYNALLLTASFAYAVATMLHTFGTIIASRKLHQELTEKVMSYPMSFFETVPIGRILNRFSSDIENVDYRVPEKLFKVAETLLATISSLILIAFMKPTFLYTVPFIFLVLYFCKALYISTSRQLIRLQCISRSPIFSLFQEALQGLVSIRAFKKQEDLKTGCRYKIDENLKVTFLAVGVNRWISFTLQTIGSFVILIAAFYCVLQSDTSPGKTGLILSSAILVSVHFGNAIREISYLENFLISVERLDEYSNLPTEAPWRNAGSYVVDSSWPDKGTVSFEDYSARYRDNLPLAIKNLSFDVASGEKVGIVGRTGAGKSTLTLALFRIVEAAGGGITIDGWRTDKLGLHDLRENISIIPQEPVIFSGTLRFNLDPFSRHEDDAIWRALELAHLKPFIGACPEGLALDCVEGGENLSMGQRQLVCLARAILRNSKILVLDEATAAVDEETDALIQRTIRSEFAGSTVLTIAHRINTIMDYDKVLVIDQGRLVEFDNPAKLTADDESAFYGLALDAGLVGV